MRALVLVAAALFGTAAFWQLLVAHDAVGALVPGGLLCWAAASIAR